MPKILLGISILFMSFALLFGFLNTKKIKDLRAEIMTANSARAVAERSRLAAEKKLKATEAAVTIAKAEASAAMARATSAEADLNTARNEKTGIESKLQETAAQLADLQKQIADQTSSRAPASAKSASDNLEAALDKTKRQLEAAEKEKALLANKVKAAQHEVAEMKKKGHDPAHTPPAIHGTVLAVNQAYNFVVLSIGEHKGVVQNSEMLVMRQGELIGKIRISSVEPTTSIGDIISNSLPHGVEVQPGDTVVYAGTSNP